MTYSKDGGNHIAYNNGIDPDITMYYYQHLHGFSYFSKLLLLVSSLVLRCAIEFPF